MKYSCPGGGAMLGKYWANFLFKPSCAGPGLRTFLPNVPTPPGPCKPHPVPDAFLWRLWVETADRLLEARGRAGRDGELVTGFVEVEERGRSTEARGVDASE